MKSDLEYALRSLGKDYVSLADVHRALEPDMSYVGFWQRVSNLPPEEQPEKHGAFRAGGYLMFNVDAGITWAERHRKYWADRQATRRAK